MPRIIVGNPWGSRLLPLRRLVDCLREKLIVAVTLWIAILLSACTSMTVTDTTGSAQAGVPPLKQYIGQDAKRVVLVFVHGVGDHCPGYALGGSERKKYPFPSGDDYWLNSEVAHAVGLRADGYASSANVIYSDEFLRSQDNLYIPRDSGSFVNLVTRKFVPDTSVSSNGFHVDAVEITWSPLTQWIKNNQLGYDATAPVTETAFGKVDPSLWCLHDPYQPSVDNKEHPPERLIGNRLLKEQVLDRELADAAIYMGKYSKTIQRGVAEALCRSFGGDTRTQPCTWPPEASAAGTRFIFVTHSLGSRIIYDTLLGLTGHGYAKTNLEDMASRGNARKFVIRTYPSFCGRGIS